MNVLTFLAIFAVMVAVALGAKSCVLSEDCGDDTGLSMCYQQRCYRNMPCNKDNDCDFWEAADIYKFQKATHRCYLVPNLDSRADGYGYCVETKVADPRNYANIMGDDVQAAANL